MDINFFIGLSFILFIILLLYTVLYTLFNYKFSSLISFLKFCHRHNTTPLIILFLSGFFFLIIYGFVNSDVYKNFLSTVAPKNTGLGPVGDFFNGLIAPTVSIITIIFLYKAFIQQYEANQMFYDSEMERSLKEDIQWLRTNYTYAQDLERELMDKDFNSLKDYFESIESVKLRKIIYSISMSQQLFLKLQTKKKRKTK